MQLVGVLHWQKKIAIYVKFICLMEGMVHQENLKFSRYLRKGKKMQVPEQAIEQLDKANLWNWIHIYWPEITGIRGQLINPKSFLIMMLANPKFLSGGGWILHKDVGNDLIDFRSLKGILGWGSLQIVFDKTTGAFWSDVDRYNPYQDVYNWVGHIFFECVPDLIKSYANNSNSNG